MNIEEKDLGELVLEVDEKPKNMATWALYSFQHVFAAFSGIVTVPFIFASVIGFNTLQTAEIIGDMLIMCGIVTIIQCRRLGMLGSGLPQIMGSGFTFVGPGIAVAMGSMGVAMAAGATKEAAMGIGFGTLLASIMVASIAQVILGFFISFLQKAFPPLVLGVIVTLIGLSILPVAVDWFAGGFGAKDYGSLSNLTLGAIVMITIICFIRYGKGVFSSGAIFFGMVTGYLAAAIMGKLDTTAVGQSGFFHLPVPFKYGMHFQIEYIVPMLVVAIVAIVESTGDTLAVGQVAKVDMSDTKRLRGGLMWGGIGSFIGTMFNATPTVPFAQNIGIVSITKIASRWVVLGAGIIFIIMGIIPKFGALIAIMPQPVLGGAGIIMFGTIAMVGIGIFKTVRMDNTNTLIAGVSLCLGLAVTFRPDILKNFPTSVKMILESGIATGSICAVLMNSLLNRGQKGNQEVGLNKKPE